MVKISELPLMGAPYSIKTTRQGRIKKDDGSIRKITNKNIFRTGRIPYKIKDVLMMADILIEKKLISEKYKNFIHKTISEISSKGGKLNTNEFKIVMVFMKRAQKYLATYREGQVSKN